MQDFKINRLYLLLGAGIVVISFAGILIKLSTAPPLIIAFYRMLFSSLIITPLFLFKYRDRINCFLDYRPAVAGLFLALHFTFWITAFEYTNVANAVIFVALQPIFTLFLELFFAREDLREGIIWGIFLALLGSIIISIGDINLLFTKIWGDLLALVAAFFGAVYLFIGRSLREKLDYFPYLYIVYTYTAFFLGLFVLVKGLSFRGYGDGNYLYFLGLALGPTLIGHSVLNYSVRFVPTTVVSLSVLAEPIITTILAWLILDESITFVTFAGALFIILGIYKVTTKTKIEENR